MSHRSRLKLASLAFAVLWTAWMGWWAWPLHLGDVVMLAVCGVTVGLVWHWLYGRWYRWHFVGGLFPRKRTR